MGQRREERENKSRPKMDFEMHHVGREEERASAMPLPWLPNPDQWTFKIPARSR